MADDAPSGVSFKYLSAGVEVNRTLVPLTRFGLTEEAYFTFSFSPLRDDDGRIAGVLQLVNEVTDAVLEERRGSLLYDPLGE